MGPTEKSLGLVAEAIEFSEHDDAANAELLVKLVGRAKRLALSEDPADRQKAANLLELVSYRLSLMQSTYE